MGDLALLEELRTSMRKRLEFTELTHHLDRIKFSVSALSVNDKKKHDKVSNIPVETMELSKLLFTTGQSMKDLPEGARLGIALGCSLAGMIVNIGIDDPIELMELIDAQSPRTMFRLGPDRMWLDPSHMRNGGIIELDILDRTKTDVDGKVEKMVEVTNGKDLINLVHMLKMLLGKELILNIHSMDLESDIDHYLVTGADGLMVRCYPGLLDPSSSPDPVASTIIASDHMMIFHSKEKGVKLQINGPVRNGSDVVKLIALGADMIGLDHFTHEFLVTYLSVKDGSGDANIMDVSSYPEDLDWAEIGELFGNILEDLKNDIRETLSLLNISSKEELDRSILTTDSYDTASITGLKLLGFGSPLPIWRHRS